MNQWFKECIKRVVGLCSSKGAGSLAEGGGMCAFPHWADCRSDGSDRSASAVVNNKQTLFCSNSLNSLQQVRVGGIFESAVNTYIVVQDPNQIKTRASPISVFDVEM